MSSPSASSSASSERMVDDETRMSARSTSTFEPTGWPVATCSSTTRRRISRLRGESCSICNDRTPRPSAVELPGPTDSGQQLCRHRAAEEPSASGQREGRLPARAGGHGEPAAHHPLAARRRRSPPRGRRGAAARRGAARASAAPAPASSSSSCSISRGGSPPACSAATYRPSDGLLRRRTPPRVETAPIPTPR